MAIYVTGDCHGEWRKLRLFSVQQNLTEDDFIIVCGDFERHLTNWLRSDLQ